ncbi:HipA domain-containing protein [Kineococcus sp. LSe6-4]|uniref:HipA domain-containing protein n=1 Tax=Kineococcus halophytocola TaxID=3234027 RepID=A0ABV4GYP1_9ACTN
MADVTDDPGRLVPTWSTDLLEHVPAGPRPVGPPRGATGRRATPACARPRPPRRPPARSLDEALSSRAAEAVGLRSAVSRGVEFDGFPALVVPRFDRHVDPATGEVSRSHQEDGAAALGLTSDEIESTSDGHGRLRAERRPCTVSVSGSSCRST